MPERHATVYEAAAELKEIGAGVALHPNAMKVLRAIGIESSVRGVAGQAPWQVMRNWKTGRVIGRTSRDQQAASFGVTGATVYRADLLGVLAGALPAGLVTLGKRCTGVRPDGDLAVARFADGSEVEADVLIGADGAHSVVRAALLGPSPISYRGYTSVGALTPAGSVPLPRDGSETWGRGIRFGVAPTSGERVVWYAVWKAPAGAAGVSTEHLLRLFGSWHEPVRAVIEATPPHTTVRKDVYDRRPGRTWTRGRVALIGDAIHLMTPDLGQGACQAMVDAVTLADCLARGGSLGAALASYQQQRWRNAAFTTMLARTFGNMGQLDRQLTCGARDALVRAMPLSVQLRQLDLVVGRPPSGQAAKPPT